MSITGPQNEYDAGVIATLRTKLAASEAALAEAKKECNSGQLLLNEICEAADWSDKSYTHAILHIKNLVSNLRCDAKAALAREAALRSALVEIRALKPKRMGGDHFNRGDFGLEPDDVFEVCDNALSAQQAPTP